MRLAISISIVALLCACESGECDAAGLQAELDGASAGDVVRANGCAYDAAAVVVPEGVTLLGIEGTVIAAPVTLRPGSSLESLTVRVERGIAVRADGAASITLDGVTIEGPLDETSASALPPMPTPDETATHGLVLVDAGTESLPIELRDVRVRGFGRIGAFFQDSHVRWTGGSASENLATGLMARGGTLALDGVEICSNWRGLQAFAYGAVFDAVRVSSTNLLVCDNEGPGLLHDAATVVHTELTGTGNQEAALWVQRGGELELGASVLSANGLSALVVVGTPLAHVADTTIEGTREVTRIVGDVGEVRAGDGIEVIVDAAEGLRLENVTLRANERVGLLLQVADGIVPSGALDGVIVEAEGDAFGAIAQTETATLSAESWSVGIERRGAAVANDSTVPDPLSVVSAVAPMFLPPPEL
jgi:hypothetical protein